MSEPLDCIARLRIRNKESDTKSAFGPGTAGVSPTFRKPHAYMYHGALRP